MTSTRSTLVVVAHPALHRSRINSRLLRVVQARENTLVEDLYETYPDFDIDVPAEQERLVAAQHIVLQYPMYWYATPALLKEWVDLVFEHGFAYGTDVDALTGKTLALAVSTGGDRGAFSADGFNRFSVEEFLRPMEATAHFCGMKWGKPFLTHGGQVIEDQAIGDAAQSYESWLNDLEMTGEAD